MTLRNHCQIRRNLSNFQNLVGLVCCQPGWISGSLHGGLPWSLDLLQPRGQHGQLGTEGRGVDGHQQGIPRASGFGKNTAKFGLVGLLFFSPTNNKLARIKTL